MRAEALGEGTLCVWYNRAQHGLMVSEDRDWGLGRKMVLLSFMGHRGGRYGTVCGTEGSLP